MSSDIGLTRRKAAAPDSDGPSADHKEILAERLDLARSIEEHELGQRSRWQQCESEVMWGAFSGFVTCSVGFGAATLLASRFSPFINRLPLVAKVGSSMYAGVLGFDRWSAVADHECAQRLSRAAINAKRASQGRPPLKSIEEAEIELGLRDRTT
eukprot:tig00000826_g4587.t1